MRKRGNARIKRSERVGANHQIKKRETTEKKGEQMISAGLARCISDQGVDRKTATERGNLSATQRPNEKKVRYEEYSFTTPSGNLKKARIPLRGMNFTASHRGEKDHRGRGTHHSFFLGSNSEKGFLNAGHRREVFTWGIKPTQLMTEREL